MAAGLACKDLGLGLANGGFDVPVRVSSNQAVLAV